MIEQTEHKGYSQIYAELNKFLDKKRFDNTENIDFYEIFYAGKDFLEPYSISTQLSCWKREVIEFEAEETSQTLPLIRQTECFYNLARREVIRLEKVQQLESDQQTENTKIDKSENENQENTNKEFTTARQVLAVTYLLNYCQIKNIDKSEIARFVEFLTNKNYKSIYDKSREPMLHLNRNGEDARYVKGWFERLGLNEIVRMIDNDLKELSIRKNENL
jgi:hypothetical protein